MYSKEYVEFIIEQQLDEKHQDLVTSIINLVPENGVLKMTALEISVKLNKEETEIIEKMEIMKSHKIPLVVWDNNAYIFSYPEKDIEYVKHLRNASSNLGMTEKDFF